MTERHRASRGGEEIPLGPAAEGVRPPWSAVPAEVVADIEERLGAPIAEVVPRRAGFSPAVAAAVTSTRGDRVFVKIAGPDPNPTTPELYRQEAVIAAALPASIPAPRLLWTYDAGGWVALAFELVDGNNPTVPWHPEELTRVMDAVGALAMAGTPSPVTAPPFRSSVTHFELIGWRSLHAGDGPVERLDPWARANLGALAELESGVGAAASGETLLHADLRADNILITRDRVVFVDWPWACVGAAWVDLLAMLPSVAMQGGPAPETLFDVHPVSRGAPPADVDAVLAALAGFFVFKGLQPDAPGLPTLRAFQRAQGKVAVAWLRRRLTGS
ncbi:MAG: aminoglycoside phosphotransferase family protein [Actinomycetota bacterium]